MAGNTLIFGNRTKPDIILEQELEEMLGERFINVLSEEEVAGYEHGMIERQLLQKYIKDFNQRFYVCGPPPMMEMVTGHLSDLGVPDNSIVQEEF